MSARVEYQRFHKGESCIEEGCRARKFYIEDGKKFCQRGHEQAGFTQTQQDEDDWNNQGKTSRKKREEKERVSTVLSGHEARELYLHCYQLILWKQCHWLVSVKAFPSELETVVRDLWGLRLGLYQKLTMESRSGYGSGTGASTVMYSSASEWDDADTDGTGRRSLSSRRSRRSHVAQEKLPKLVETLGLCYLAMLLMRLPTSLGEIYKWATQEEILYNRAIKEIPKEMRAKLPQSYHSALEIRAPLKQANLHKTVLELMEFFHLQFEMVFPPLNYPLLLFKHVRDLGLPVEIFPAVHRLAVMLGIDFSYPLSHKRGYSVSPYPEIRLICLIVIATKLGHPFDHIPRVPESNADPATVRIDWVQWRRIMTEVVPPEGLKRGEEIHVTDKDVMSMNAKKMDDYLDWYQRTWIDDRDPKIAEQILDLFPLPNPTVIPPPESNHEAKLARLKQVQSTLLLQNPSPVITEGSEDIKRPGELYKRYRSISELSEEAKAFYSLAAQNAGASLKTLVRGVYHLEVQIDKWSRADRKRTGRDKERAHVLSESDDD